MCGQCGVRLPAEVWERRCVVEMIRYLQHRRCCTARRRGIEAIIQCQDGLELSDDTPVVHVTKARGALLLLEGIPEAESLVTGAGDDDLAVGAHGEVEHSVGVAGQRDDLLHAGVLPDDDLVLAVTVCGDNLVAVLGPSKVAHLTSGVQAVDEICWCRRRNRDVGRA